VTIAAVEAIGRRGFGAAFPRDTQCVESAFGRLGKQNNRRIVNSICPSGSCSPFSTTVA